MAGTMVGALSEGTGGEGREKTGRGKVRIGNHSREFRLLRYYSLASLVAFGIVAGLLGTFFRKEAVANLVEVGESKNAALTQTFANTLWPEFEPFINEAGQMSVEELRDHPETQRLHEAVAAQTMGLSVVKIKIYDMDGLTVYSSEPAQIGNDESDNEGFLTALEGGVVSGLSHRDTFNAFDMELQDRDVIESYVPIQPDGPDGAVLGVIEVYDDVTPLMQNIQQAQARVLGVVVLMLATLYGVLYLVVRHGDTIISRQQAEVEEATRLKSLFVANVSHELRTPLSAIMMYSELMQRGAYGELSEEQGGASSRVLGAAGRLLALIEDLLDLSRIEAGRLDLNMVPVQPRAVVESVVRVAEPNARAKDLKLRYEIGEGAPESVTSDEIRLTQVLQNLVDNAIKFTDKGEVSLEVAANGGKHVKFTIADTGEGIGPDQLDKIFDQFYQVSGEAGRRKGGLGLGLNITRNLVAAMGGSIAVKSTPGSGTTFEVLIPREPLTGDDHTSELGGGNA